MPEEERDTEKTIARLAGEVAALRILVESIATMLPDRALYALARSTDWERDILERIAREKDTDGARDFAAGFWDVSKKIKARADTEIDGREEGSRLRLVQAAPLERQDMLFPEKGW